MATLSDNLEIVLLAYGEEGYGGFTNYGDVQNANWEIVEAALSEQSAITVNTADVTLTDAQQQSLYLNLTGTLTGNRSIVTQVGKKGFWFVKNGTSGAYTVTVKPSGGTGIEVVQGTSAIVYCDGSAAHNINAWAAKAVPTGTVVGTTDTQPLSNKKLVDSSVSFVDEADDTKQFKVQVSGVSTGTTRVMTLPDYDFTVASLAGAETFTSKSLSDSTTYVIDNSDTTKKFQFQASAISTGTTRTYTAPNKDGTLAMVSDIGLDHLKTYDSPVDIASIDFTTDVFSSDFDFFVFRIRRACESSQVTSTLNFRLSDNSGSSFISSGYNYMLEEISGTTENRTAPTGQNQVTMMAASFGVQGVTRADHPGITGELILDTFPVQPANQASINNECTFRWSLYQDRGGTQYSAEGKGRVPTSGRVNGIRFYPSAGIQMGLIIEVFGGRNS